MSNSELMKPTLRALLDSEEERIFAKMNCVSIGTIVEFDVATQLAKVSVNYKRIIRGGNVVAADIATDKIIDYPLLVNVPVIVLQGGEAFISFPIKAGDQCLLLFCDREIDTWLAGAVTPQAPVSDRAHDLNDAVALVGARQTPKAIQSFSSTKSVWSFLTGLLSAIDKTGERLHQSGFLQPYAGSTAPSGWLLCYGQEVSRSTYSELFSVIGTTYGAGDNSTTFNLPDLRGRVPVGLDNIGGSSANRLTNTYTPNRNTLGGGIGEEAHQLTIPELPAHTHANWYNHSSGSGSESADGGSNCNRLDATSGSTGGDVPHNTVQPGIMVNWIIKI